MTQTPIIIRGSIHEVMQRVDRLGLAISLRRMKGVPILHPDGRWRFLTSASACERCSEYDGHIFEGSEIFSTFPNYRIISDNTIHPEYHEALGWSTPCYCSIELLNLEEIGWATILQDGEEAVR